MSLTKIILCSIGLFVFNNLFWLGIIAEKNSQIKKQKAMLDDLAESLDTKDSLINGYLKTRETAEKRANEAERKYNELLGKRKY